VPPRQAVRAIPGSADPIAVEAERLDSGLGDRPPAPGFKRLCRVLGESPVVERT
jgi:hypothetical protein